MLQSVSKKQVRGFAPIGMVECWNNGLMGELVLNEVEGKEFFIIKMVYFHPYSRHSDIPTFHYSILVA